MTAVFKLFYLNNSQYDGQSDEYSKVLNVANIVFTAVFTIEFILKLFAFRFKVFCAKANFMAVKIGILNTFSYFFLKNYFGDPWNCFDFFIVLGSVIDIVYEQLSVRINLVFPCATRGSSMF